MSTSKIETAAPAPIEDAQVHGSDQNAGVDVSGSDGPVSDEAGPDSVVADARAMSEAMADLTAQTLAFWSNALAAAGPAAGAADSQMERAPQQQASRKTNAPRRSWYRKPVDTPLQAMMKFWGVDSAVLPFAGFGTSSWPFLGWPTSSWSAHAWPASSWFASPNWMVPSTDLAQLLPFQAMWFAPWVAGSSNFMTAKFNPFDWPTSFPGWPSGDLQQALFKTGAIPPNPLLPDMNALVSANDIWDPAGAWNAFQSFWQESGAPWPGTPRPGAGPDTMILDAWNWLANPFEIAKNSSARSGTERGARHGQNLNGAKSADRDAL